MWRPTYQMAHFENADCEAICVIPKGNHFMFYMVKSAMWINSSTSTYKNRKLVLL